MAFPLAGQNDILNRAQGLFNDPRFKALPESVQQTMSLIPVVQAFNYDDPKAFDQRMQSLEGMREREARRAQELGKESVNEAFKYTTLANIPKTIAQSFGNIAAMNLLGGQSVANTFSNTLAAYPRPQFSQYQFQPEKYFG